MTGRHRSPPMLARWFPHIAVAAVLLTAASLIAIYATGIAPDATAMTQNGLAVSTAARSARTVHVPLTVLPVPVPETTPSAPGGGLETTWGVPRRPVEPSQPAQEALAAITEPTLTDQQPATQPEATTTAAPPAETAAATTESSATDTEEPTVTAEPTADPTPTDIGDVIDEVLGETP